MALFDRSGRADEEYVASSDVATRALSVTAVETDFVAGVYEKLASVYDIVFGPTLHAGRLQALKRMAIAPGDRVLEVGRRHRHQPDAVSAGLQVTGVDLSDSMLEKAHERVAKNGLRDVRLLQMDASALTFPDESFDIVYAPYLVSVVPDPGPGRARDAPGLPARRPRHHPEPLPQLEPDRLLGRALDLTADRPIGFKSDLDLPAFLAQAELHPVSIEKVNIPPIWSLVTCIKD